MSNGKTPSGSERKEPQLSSMTNLDRLRDEAGKPPMGDFSHTTPTTSTITSNQRAGHGSQKNSVRRSDGAAVLRASNGRLWFVVLLLTLALVAVSGYAYMEFDRVNGMQRTMLERVNVLAAASDQFDTKLSASGGQLQETQSSVNARVTQLEKKVLEQLKLVEQSAQQGQSIASDLKTQLAAELEKQAKAFQSTTGALKVDLMSDLKASLDQRIGNSDALNQTQTKALDTLKQSVAAIEKRVAAVSTDLKQETTGFNQSLQLLKEELAIDPARLKTLQEPLTLFLR